MCINRQSEFNESTQIFVAIENEKYVSKIEFGYGEIWNFLYFTVLFFFLMDDKKKLNINIKALNKGMI